ncbi:titin-like isoform X2 [Mercenaria mercenaria]|nr:titin-like isoform X2 [Mercenaria mercenaria]
MQGYFKPTDCVKKEGDDVQFECRSPAGYTSMNYPNIAFSVEHNGVLKFTRSGPDKQKGNFTSRVFSIPDVTKQDAGNYTCHIILTGNGRDVTVSTQLFVVEAEEKTTFVRKGEDFRLDCLSAGDHGFLPVVDWFVNGSQVGMDPESAMYTSESSLYVAHAAIANAFQDIRCKVVSEKAYKNHGSVEAAFDNGSGTEFHKSLSVVDVSTCKVVPCQLPIEARVYGGTSVNISWKLDGKLLNSSTTMNDSVSISTTDVLNSTISVLLIVTGGQNVWSQNVSLDSSEHAEHIDTETEGLAWWIIAVLVIIFVAAVIIVIVVIVCCRNRQRNTGTARTREEGVPLNDLRKGDEGEKPAAAALVEV